MPYAAARKRRELNVVLDLPVKMQGIQRPYRYKVFEGGRGGTKSWTVAGFLVLLAATTRKRILCCREFQNSIKDSVHQLLCDEIEKLGLSGVYKITIREITCLTTGSTFIFHGLHHNIDTIKSLEGIDICWVEEGQNTSENSWKILIPTIRKAGSEIWITLNPDLETDPTYKRFIINTPPRTLLVHIGWEDNPWLPKELRDEKDYLYSVDPDAAAHIWGGSTRVSSEAQILHGKIVVEAFDPGDDWDGPYLGADWGFSQDPTALIKMWIYEQRLYIERESWALRLEISETADRWRRDIPGIDDWQIYADNARPETISHVAKDGLNIKAASKWTGCVEDGIAFLRSFVDIVVHPRCTHFEQETRLYSWKEDRLTGDILTTIVDRHNHLIDAARYGLDKIIRKGKGRKVQFL